jgi:hypothetical protein
MISTIQLMLHLEVSNCFADFSGLARHTASQLPIVTAQALVSTHKGDAIETCHQMALLGKRQSILSFIQMEAFGADINDQSQSIPGGKQRILMDGYQLWLEFKNGLTYLHCLKPTDNELSLLPHIITTLDVTWDASFYDNINDNIDQFYDTLKHTPEHEYHFDRSGEY